MPGDALVMLDGDFVPAAHVVRIGGRLHHIDDCVSCCGCGDWFLNRWELDDDYLCDACAQDAADERDYISTRVSTFRDREG